MAERFSFATADERKRGVCDVCGSPARHHMAYKCEEHADTKTKRAAQPVTNVKVDDVDGPRIVIDRPEPAGKPGGAAKSADEKAARALQLERSILTDLNPAVIQGFAMLCKPIDPAVFYTVEGSAMVLTEIGSTVVFSDGEAKLLGKAAAELERSPIGVMAAGAVGPLVPIALGIAAAGVVVFHGYRVMGLRQALLEQVRAQEQAQAMNDAGMYQPPAEPTVGEDVADGFRQADVRGFGTTRANGAGPTITPDDVLAS